MICYGQTRDEAISNAERLAIEVIADRIVHGEMPSSALAVSFSIQDGQLASPKALQVLAALERPGWQVKRHREDVGPDRQSDGIEAEDL